MKVLSQFLACILLVLTSICLAEDKIHFGVTSYYPPYVFNAAGGQVDGLDIQVAQGICKELNVTCTFTQVPLSKGFNLLNEGKIDALIGGIPITSSKKLLFSFSKPYFKSTASLLTASTSNLTADKTGLSGRRLGVIKDSAYYTFAYTNYPNIHLVTFDNAEQLASALINNKVDVILLDSVAANYWMGYNQRQFKKIGPSIEIPGNEGLGIVVKKGNNKLLTQINQSIDSLNSDNRLYNRIRRFVLEKGKI